MIRKFVFGTPFPTEAVVAEMEAQTGALPYFSVRTGENTRAAACNMEQGLLNKLEKEAFCTGEAEKTCFYYEMGKQDVVYGLGQNIRGINKRGWTYTSYAADEPNQTESIRSLYAAHNFLIVDGKNRFGVFVDYPGRLEFDVGYTHIDRLSITPDTMDLDVYIIEGDTLQDIVRQFRSMIGRSYIAPRWALGYGQSRWGYACADDIRAVADGYRSNHVGLDMIYMDIDYMRGFRNFTVDENAYPDFPAFVSEMRKRQIHLVPIIDAGVKAEPGYHIDDEGVAKQYYMKNGDGTDFVGTVWPGDVHFPDFLNPEVRAWFGEHYRFLLDQGIDGFWNDMNEPAIFYSKRGMEAFKKKAVDTMLGGTDADMLALGWAMGALKNSREDYSSIFHNVGGKTVCHDAVHNLYGYNMTRSAGEAFEALRPNERILMFSRASYTGMHRYGGLWTGDNQSWWSHLKMNLTMLPGLSMQGFLYSGADLGGFGSDCTEDLLLRWLQLGVFTPLMRNHAAKGTREQEVYRFTDLAAFRNIIGLRYFLLPYLYSEYMKACVGGEMLFKPLSFEYEDDPFASQVEDQLMLGDSVMIAPVLQQNATGRYVYLPEEMKLLRLRSKDDFDEEILPKGHHYVSAQLQEMLLFIRPDRLIVTSRGGQCVEDVDFENVVPIGFVKTKASYAYYHDDGISKDFDLQKHITEITLQ